MPTHARRHNSPMAAAQKLPLARSPWLTGAACAGTTHNLRRFGAFSPNLRQFALALTGKLPTMLCLGLS